LDAVSSFVLLERTTLQNSRFKLDSFWDKLAAKEVMFGVYQGQDKNCLAPYLINKMNMVEVAATY